MRVIVFSTIAENIRSFFQREEELTAKPKTVPEAASEVYGKTPAIPTAVSSSPQRIVDKPLPSTPARLPFSPDDLRSALKSNMPQEQPRQEQQRPVSVAVERDISHEIAAFENALRSAHTSVAPTPQPTAVIRDMAPAKNETMVPQSSVTVLSPMDGGFFDEFGQFLAREDLQHDGVLDRDIVWRMKEFHKYRQEGKEFYLYSKDVQQAVQRKLEDLKVLERNWFNKREIADELDRELIMLENDIEARTSDMRQLIMQAQAKSRLEKKARQGHEFVLADGRKLTSLLDLRLSLRTMPDSVFSHHVTAMKNDFASWVREGLGDATLADQMGAIRDKAHLEMFLARLTN